MSTNESIQVESSKTRLADFLTVLSQLKVKKRHTTAIKGLKPRVFCVVEVESLIAALHLYVYMYM